MKEIKEALSKIREEWTFLEYPQGSIEIFEKESKAIICITSPTDSNGRFDGSVITKFPTWLAELISKVEKMQKTLEWYAGEQYGTVMFYPPIPDIPILHDCGDRARQALKGGETK